jgi:hypothetical protein
MAPSPRSGRSCSFCRNGFIGELSLPGIKAVELPKRDRHREGKEHKKGSKNMLARFVAKVPLLVQLASKIWLACWQHPTRAGRILYHESGFWGKMPLIIAASPQEEDGWRVGLRMMLQWHLNPTGQSDQQLG